MGELELLGRLAARPWCVGGGRVEETEAGIRLVRPAGRGRYANAQLDDYRGLPRRAFPWRPPLTLTVEARLSHPGVPPLGRPQDWRDRVRRGELLAGTAGFGFWNDPFWMTGRRRPTLPRALWFFYAAPPSDLRLHEGLPGWGWTAATLDAVTPWILPLPLLIPAFACPPLYRRLWPSVRRRLRIAVAPIPLPLTAWHTFRIDWEPDRVRFRIDGRRLLEAPFAPRGPLGFVLWIDNQFMAAAPWGRFRAGVVDVDQDQWMDVGRVTVTAGDGP